ncbi:hypothetical protein [Pseudoalteromonas gelatinilytica]
MTSEKREILYNLEKEYVEQLIKGGDTSSVLGELNTITSKICVDFQEKAVNSIHVLIKLSSEIYFDSSFLKSATLIETSSLTDFVTEQDFLQAKEFVSDLLRVDLENVGFLFLPKQVENNTEGFCVSCCDEKHHVFIQNDQFGVVSKDLLVHELGHAADFTISRSIDNDNLLVKHSSISEAVAYYCQYKYLLEFSEKHRRIGAFGAFLLTYLSICILRYCLANDSPLNEIIPEIAVNDEHFLNIVNSYGHEGRDFVVGKIHMLKEQHKELGSLVYNEISPRFGMVLALKLLDKTVEEIVEIIQINSIDNDLAQIVEKILSPTNNGFGSVQNHFEDFFD